MIIGETRDQIDVARAKIERILKSDEATRDRIRKEQLSVGSQLIGEKKDGGTSIDLYRQQMGRDNQSYDETMMTPYGPPSNNARIVYVPNDVVGLVIGKNGETIRQLQTESGAKIQVAKQPMQDT